MDEHILDSIKKPSDVKKLDSEQTDRLCVEIRNILIDTVSQTGGHLASNLGVVELTVAYRASGQILHSQTARRTFRFFRSERE